MDVAGSGAQGEWCRLTSDAFVCMCACLRAPLFRYRFAIDVNKPALMGAPGRVFSSLECKLSQMRCAHPSATCCLLEKGVLSAGHSAGCWKKGVLSAGHSAHAAMCVAAAALPRFCQGFQAGRRSL
eukprot:1138055-Pelagomonas_calceolata.AAC.3